MNFVQADYIVSLPAVSPNQTMRRRVLLTGGSGADSTTKGGLAIALDTRVAAPPAGGGIAGPAGFSATATDVSLFGLLSTPVTSPEKPQA